MRAVAVDRLRRCGIVCSSINKLAPIERDTTNASGRQYRGVILGRNAAPIVPVMHSVKVHACISCQIAPRRPPFDNVLDSGFAFHARKPIADLATCQATGMAIESMHGQQHGLAMSRNAINTDDMSPASIGRRLELIRVAHGLSKSEIADMLGIDRTHWSRFEGGQRAIPYDKASRLVDRFGVSLDFIILGRWRGMDVEVADRLRASL